MKLTSECTRAAGRGIQARSTSRRDYGNVIPASSACPPAVFIMRSSVMIGARHILAEIDWESAGKRLIRLSRAFVVQPETRRAVMLNLKRKAIAIAILAIPAALASAQSGSPGFRTVINPEDSGYFGP